MYPLSPFLSVILLPSTSELVETAFDFSTAEIRQSTPELSTLLFSLTVADVIGEDTIEGNETDDGDDNNEVDGHGGVDCTIGVAVCLQGSHAAGSSDNIADDDISVFVAPSITSFLFSVHSEFLSSTATVDGTADEES